MLVAASPVDRLTPVVAAPRLGRFTVAAAWGTLALLLMALAGSDITSGEFHGISGRGEWFTIGMALSCLLAGLIALAGAPVAAVLTGTLFLGGIAQLWLTESDWFSAVVFAPRSTADIPMLGLLVIEALVAVGALWRMFGLRIIAHAREFGFARLAFGLALLTVLAVSLFRYLLSDNYDGYIIKLVLKGALTLAHLCAMIALAAAPDLPRLSSVLRRVSAWLPTPALGFALVALLLSAALSYFAFYGLGAVEDETAYLFQARTFAAGLLVAPPLPPGLAASFDYYLLDPTETGWLATTSPGWPAVLALGVLAGVPWLVNPLLGAVGVYLSHRFVERCSDRWTANLVGLLMATSPWLLAMSASYMTHALSLALIAGAWLATVVARQRFDDGDQATARGLALLAGLLLGWLFLTRALEGVVIGGLTGLWLLWTLRLRGWLVIGLYALGCVLTGALLIAYNVYFTGDPLVMPLTEYLNRLWGRGANDFGFGSTVGPPEGWRNLDLWPGHSPLEGLINTISAMPSLNMELLGWPVGSLVLILALALWGRANNFANSMWLVVAAVIGIHLFYWFNAVFYVGPRYWYAAVLPMFVLSAYGARSLIARLESAGAVQAQERVVTTIVLMAIFATAIFLPWRGVEKYSQRVGTTYAIERWLEQPHLSNTLVFLHREAFGHGAFLLDPLLGAGNPIIAHELDAKSNARVIAAFPGRQVIFPRCETPEMVREVFLPVCLAIGEGKGDGEVGQDSGKGDQSRLRQ